jgi:hypothetical protein
MKIWETYKFPKWEYVEQYRKKWQEHIDRMNCDRILEKILKYQPKWNGS